MTASGGWALSLLQPWATLCVAGAKAIETRGWRTAYRGPLWIHASKGTDDMAEVLSLGHPDSGFFRSALVAAGCLKVGDIPLGAIVGSVRLVDCIPIASVHIGPHARERHGVIELVGYGGAPPIVPARHEASFGNYGEPGRWAWLLADPVKIDPVRCRGALNIWRVPNLTKEG